MSQEEGMMKVLLEVNVWLADGEGDPPRTTDESHAKEFGSKLEAYRALESARQYRPFPNAEITDDFF